MKTMLFYILFMIVVPTLCHADCADYCKGDGNCIGACEARGDCFLYCQDHDSGGDCASKCEGGS